MCSSPKTFQLCSPLGIMTLQVCKKGFHELKLTDINLQEDFQPVRDKDVVFFISDTKPNDKDTHALGCREWLNMYFSDPSNAHLLFKPPLCQSVAVDGSLKKAVLEVLHKRDRTGELLTYTDLAEQLAQHGLLRRAQHLAHVLKSNPILIFVPTHRVIRRNNQLGSFSYEPSVKTWLLRHEGIFLN